MKYDINQRMLIFDYENLLLGRTQKLTEGLISDEETVESRRKKAGFIWRYAITHYLKWTSLEAVHYMTDEIVEKLMLNKFYKKMEIDPERTIFGDYRFILQYAFPGEVKYDIGIEAFEVYQRCYKIGRWRNNTEEYKLPKKFFYGPKGEQRANAILNNLVSLYLGDKSTEELYDKFSRKPSGRKWIREKHLGEPLTQIYDNEPLEFFHAAMDESRKDDLFYYAAKIRDTVEKEMKTNKENDQDTT